MTAGETPSGMVGAWFESLFTVDCLVARLEMETYTLWQKR